MAGGRPTLYKPEYCESLVEHMTSGLSFESFAGKIKTNRDTLYEWAKVHPEFSDAKSRGAVASLLFWEEQGRNCLYAEKFQSSVYIFTMKARFKWADQVVVKNEKEESDREKVKQLSTPEINRLIKENDKEDEE